MNTKGIATRAYSPDSFRAGTEILIEVLRDAKGIAQGFRTHRMEDGHVVSGTLAGWELSAFMDSQERKGRTVRLVRH